MAILGYKNSTRFIRSFGLAEWLQTRGLAGWLEIATAGLETPARQRIASEIGAHYAEAVRDHLAEGESEHSAQASALAELGDPQEAALSFRKSHLTESEANSMKWMAWAAAKPLFSLSILPLDILPLAGILLISSHADLISEFWILFAGLLLAYGGFRLIPRLLCPRTLPRISFLRRLALSIWLTEVAFGICYGLFVYTVHHNIL